MTKRVKWMVLGMAIFLVFSAQCQKIKEPKNKIPTPQPSVLYAIIRDGKWGYIDKTCKIVIKPQFDSAEQFSDGLALVRIGREIGSIDKTGKFVCNPE